MVVKILNSNLEQFIQSLEKKTIAKVLRVIDLLEEFGNNLQEPHSKKVQGSIFELRIRGRQEVRIFYIFSKNSAVLLHGYIKKKQKAPIQEIQKAVVLARKCNE
jgi:hypothetical protein